MKMRSYGGDYINPSLEDLAHGKAGHKKLPHVKDDLTYPMYPDSVEGYISEQRETLSSIKKHQKKKNSRVN